MRTLSSLAVLIGASSAFGAAVNVNGTCLAGNCGSPDTVAVGASPSTAFNFVFTMANGDQYRIAGNVNFPNSATSIGVTAPFTVAYLGNTAGTASGADVLTIDFLQNDAYTSTSGTFFESAVGGFSGPIGTGSSLEGQLFIGGHALPLQGPFTAPANFSSSSSNVALTGLTNPLSFDLRRTITFAAGSGVGATVYNGLTPGGTGSSGSNAPEVCTADGTGSTLPIYRSPGGLPRDTTASGCGVIVCSEGGGSTLPIYRRGPQPEDAAASTSSCSITTDDGGAGSTLPILVYDPTAPPDGGIGSTLPILVFQGGGPVATDGAGGTLPILVFDGGGGTLPILVDSGGGATLPVLNIAELGSGSTLPIYRSGGNAARATPAGNGFSIEIATPLQSAAAAYTAVATCPGTTSNCWITIPVASGNIAAASRTAITAIVNPQGLQPGTYTANVAMTITPTGQTLSYLLNLPVTFALSPPGPNMVLSQTGLQFFAIAGTTSLPTQTISVSNSGSGSLSLTTTASTLSGNWLSTLPVPSPSGLEVVAIQANPTGLAPGVYSGLVEFSSPGAVNGTQSVEVTLTVSAASPTANATPSISSTALIFVAPQGSNAATSAAPQAVQLSNPSSQTLTVSTSVAFASGNGWFTATASAGTVTSAQPLTETIAVNSASLAPGVYLGSMDIHIAETNTDYPVEVLLVVKAASCTPTQLLPAITNLGGGFQMTAGIPAPLTAQVVDDCGTPLTSGSVLAYFPGGDPSVSMTSRGSGQWSGTWMPHSIAAVGAATVGIMATSFAPALYGSSGVVGSLAANPAMPLVSAGGVASSASFTNVPLAPGGLISIFGSNLATGTVLANATLYPPTLGGTQVLLGGVAIPMQVVTQGQINAVVPYDVPVGVPQQLIVQQGAAYAMPETVVVAEAQPEVFTLNESGQGAGAIVVVKANGTQFVNGPTAPASAGDALVIYCAGLGNVSPAVPAGSAAPLSTLSYAASTVTVTVGGVPAQVFFAGLAPGFVGLYQVNAYVPTGVAPGANVPVVVSAAGAASVPVTVAIQ